jgi:large subunit ribosomal protein L17
MNHGRKVPKLQRKASHRKALLANLVCALIEHRRIRTTLAKAKAVRPLAEKMLTLGKRGDLHARRLAVAALHHKALVKTLFEEIAPASKERAGGYTRIIKLGQRRSDSAPMAFIEWVDAYTPAAEVSAPATEEVAEAKAE